jgi:hypothetical protein
MVNMFACWGLVFIDGNAQMLLLCWRVHMMKNRRLLLPALPSCNACSNACWQQNIVPVALAVQVV